MPTDRVVLVVTWEEIGGAGQPAEALHALALRDLSVNRGYDADEVRVVAEDPVLSESCADAARRLYRLEQHRKRGEMKHPDEPPGAVREKVALHFTRPPSRGWANREIDLADRERHEMLKGG